MAQAVSSEIDSTFYSVSSSDLLSSWFGESEKLIKELFAHARQQNNRAIIFVDEIDSLCRKRSSQEAETTRRVKTELLKQMEGATAQNDQTDIFFLCATNRPWELDAAFLRRFEKRIYVSLPTRKARRELFDIHLKDIDIAINYEEWEILLDKTEGYSGSDLTTCISDATIEPIRELNKSIYWRWSDDRKTLRPCNKNDKGAVALRLGNIPKEKVQPRPVKYNDLVKSLKANHSTVSLDDMEKYENFTKSFGQVG